jgi:hypothetical protein
VAWRRRFEALRGSKLTRLVARDEEIDLLLRRWARAKAVDGHIILVSGEPGIESSAGRRRRSATRPLYPRFEENCTDYL